MIRSSYLFLLLLVPLRFSVSLCQEIENTPPNNEVAFRKAVLIQFGTRENPLDISPLSEAYFNRKLDKAKKLGADLLIVEIDSPGGFIEASLNLANTLRDTKWAKTVAYIPRQALSGAAIMSLGCDEILMNENAHIGDAGPIFLDENFLFRHAPEKIRSDLVSKVRALSKSRGRPPAIAEAMVDMDLEVFKVTHADTGAVTYKSDAELRALDDPTQWHKGGLLEPSKKGLFLEVDGSKAVTVGLADDIVNSRAALAARFDKKGDEIIVMESTWIDTMVTVLNFWPLTVLLFIVGVIALYIELAAPGIGVGGLVSGLCFSLFFWSRFLGGTAGWLEIVLFAVGVIFLLVELFVIPGFGVAGVTGILLLLVSLVMAGHRWGTADGLSVRELTNSVLYLAGAGVASVIGVIALSKYFGALRLFKHLTLEPPEPAVAVAGTLASGLGSGGTTESPLSLSVGEDGIADSPLRPAGRVLFGDMYRDVVTDGSFVDKGARVRIVKISGTHITVRETA